MKSLATLAIYATYIHLQLTEMKHIAIIPDILFCKSYLQPRRIILHTKIILSLIQALFKGNLVWTLNIWAIKCLWWDPVLLMTRGQAWCLYDKNSKNRRISQHEASLYSYHLQMSAISRFCLLPWLGFQIFCTSSSRTEGFSWALGRKL